MAWLMIHPVLQAAATLLAGYVLVLGAQRVLSRRLHRKTAFRWRRHVVLGKAALLLWTAGLLGGAAVTVFRWGAILGGPHFRLAMVMLPLLAIVLGTGLALQRPKRNPPLLVLVHGAAASVMMLVALGLVYTGAHWLTSLLPA